MDPSNHVLWSNRSAVFAKLGQWDKALSDAEKTIEVNPSWVRGYSRKGAALHGLKRYKEAIDTYKKGLEIEPNNEALKQSIASIENEIYSSGQNIFTQFAKYFEGNFEVNLKLIPAISHLGEDQEFMRMAYEIKDNPSAISKYLNDQRIMTYVSAMLQLEHGFPSEEEETPKPEPEKKKEEKVEPQLTEAQIKANELKDEGNKLYKARKFEEAIELYDKAYETDPDNLYPLLNKTAVYFEQKEYEKCIKECEALIDLAKEKRADFKIIAKALARIGTTKVKLGEKKEAIEYYNRSLTEFRDPHTLKLLRDLEKQIEEEERLAYINPELSEKAKEEGNAHFKEGRFPEAIKCYNEAIKRNPSNHVLYTNRATAFSKLNEFPSVIKDCDECLKLKPDFVKAYIRKAFAYHMMKEYGNALEWYEKGLKIDPDNAELKAGYQKTLMVLQGFQKDAEDEKLTPEERLKKAMANPEVASILEDQVFMQIVQQMAQDPNAAAEHMKNPEVRRRVAILKAAGIVG